MRQHHIHRRLSPSPFHTLPVHCQIHNLLLSARLLSFAAVRGTILKRLRKKNALQRHSVCLERPTIVQCNRILKRQRAERSCAKSLLLDSIHFCMLVFTVCHQAARRQVWYLEISENTRSHKRIAITTLLWCQEFCLFLYWQAVLKLKLKKVFLVSFFFPGWPVWNELEICLQKIKKKDCCFHVYMKHNINYSQPMTMHNKTCYGW